MGASKIKIERKVRPTRNSDAWLLNNFEDPDTCLNSRNDFLKLFFILTMLIMGMEQSIPTVNF